MIPKELFKKIKKIEIRTSHLVNDIFGGKYQSVFKGRGMEFSEVREYQFGDDIRSIDWNVTARMSAPYVKKFTEERELTVMLLVDLSSSGQFGTVSKMKGEIAAEISALLAFSAIKNNDKVGLFIFTDKKEIFIPPKKGKQHVLRVVREILNFKPEKRSTNMKWALEYFNKVIRKKSVVFLISDFLDVDYEKPLKIVKQKHDLITINITDPCEIEIPNLGLIELEDSETGETILIDSSDLGFRTSFNQFTVERDNYIDRLFKKVHIDTIKINTKESYIDPIVKFFKMRQARI